MGACCSDAERVCDLSQVVLSQNEDELVYRDKRGKVCRVCFTQEMATWVEVACVLVELEDVPTSVAHLIGEMAATCDLGVWQAAAALVTFMRNGHGTPGPLETAMQEAIYIFGITVCARMRRHERALELGRLELALQTMKPSVLDCAVRARRHAVLLDARRDQQVDVRMLALFARQGDCHPEFDRAASRGTPKPPNWGAPPVPR